MLMKMCWSGFGFQLPELLEEYLEPGVFHPSDEPRDDVPVGYSKAVGEVTLDYVNIVLLFYCLLESLKRVFSFSRLPRRNVPPGEDKVELRALSLSVLDVRGLGFHQLFEHG